MKGKRWRTRGAAWRGKEGETVAGNEGVNGGAGVARRTFIVLIAPWRIVIRRNAEDGSIWRLSADEGCRAIFNGDDVRKIYIYNDARPYEGGWLLRALRANIGAPQRNMAKKRARR